MIWRRRPDFAVPAARGEPWPTPEGPGALYGLVLASLFAGWAVLRNPGAVEGRALAFLTVTGMGCWAAGAVAARGHRVIAALGVPALVVVSYLVGYPESLGGSPTAPPLGYANANGALATAAVAGLLVTSPSTRWSRALVGSSVALLTVLALMMSIAAGISCLLLTLVWPAIPHGRGRTWQLLSGALMGAAVLVTVALGATYTPHSQGSAAESVLSEARVALWSDALTMAAANPLTGVGPGNFAAHSPTATADADLSEAHSAPLGVLAELGAIGLTIACGVVCWMVWRLDGLSPLVAVLSLQASIDYVLDFPAVVAAFAFVLGVSSGHVRRDTGGRGR